MKKLIKNIFLFLFPIIICLGIIEFSLRKVPNDYSYKNDYLTKNSGEIEVLYLGSSHIFFGVNPEFSKYKGFNLAMTSQDLSLDWKLFNNFKDWKNLKTIVIPIDYISLYSKLEYGIEDWRMKNYTIYNDISSNKFEDHLEIFNGKFSDNIKRLKNYYQYGKTDIDCNQYGFGTLYKSSVKNDLISSAKIAAKRHSITIDSEKGKRAYIDNTKAIENFIYYAKKNKINILFVSAPVTEYYSNLTKNEQLYTTFSFLKKQIENNNNCHYLNLMNDSEFNDGYFFDADHLNNLGAKKFTIKIDSAIQNIP
ncbi:hypothetical protein SAMN05421866_0031 [Chryseobacterium oranimense]|uniref:DUF1574 domain-containing protein n=1 Tax=Chryseobacterium oranimense TaxID=421058 RepID=A0A1M5X7J7_9FLAO|nr:hypothetical protein [Chryseobacterium oranimense]SHH95805.1 hypothetical protein SAMN05421866_0031 [Chryseobacterium oranimense]